MAYTILIQNRVAAQKVDSFNRSVISASDIENGWVFYLDGIYSADGYEEVWEAKQPTTGSLADLWMAASPEIVLTDSKYRGINPDPQDFINSASRVFDAFLPQPGDIITVTADGLTGTAEKDYAVAQVTAYELLWADAPVTDVLSLRYLETTHIPVGSGSAIGTQRKTAYKFEVLWNKQA